LRFEDVEALKPSHETETLEPMDQSLPELNDVQRPPRAAVCAMSMTLGSGWFYGALIVVLAGWILHSFLQTLLAACVTAIASWPLYMRFSTVLLRRTGRSTRSLIFTCAMSVFVLVPLLFAFGAVLTEAHALLVAIAAVDKNGIAIPPGWRACHSSDLG
jgi:predicted PurR-regulated permease PerM